MISEKEWAREQSLILKIEWIYRGGQVPIIIDSCLNAISTRPEKAIFGVFAQIEGFMKHGALGRW